MIVSSEVTLAARNNTVSNHSSGDRESRAGVPGIPIVRQSSPHRSMGDVMWFSNQEVLYLLEHFRPHLASQAV